MEKQRDALKCPLCNGEFDRGLLQTTQVRLHYVSDRAPRDIFGGASLNDPQVNVLACLDCGHIEVYLDPEALRKRIGR